MVPLIPNLGNRDERLTSSPGRFIPGKYHGNHRKGGQVGPRGGQNFGGKGKFLLLLPGFEPRDIPSVTQSLHRLRYCGSKLCKEKIRPTRSHHFLGDCFKKNVVNYPVFDLEPCCIVLNNSSLKRIYELILYYLYKICFFLSFPDEVSSEIAFWSYKLGPISIELHFVLRRKVLGAARKPSELTSVASRSATPF